MSNLTQNTLLTPEERKRLKARQRTGGILKFLTVLPIVLAILLILFVFLSNINNAFVWQTIKRTGSSSGMLFDKKEVTSQEKGFELELEARGDDPAETLSDEENRRKFLLRSRIDHLPEANGEKDKVIVWTSRDKIVDQRPYLEGRRLKSELAAEAAEEGYDFALNPLLDKSFLSRNGSSRPHLAGFRTAIVGTLWVIMLVILLSTVVGVGTAVYLEEYAPKNWFSAVLEVNLRNLAGVPSIVYGLLGAYTFVRSWQMGSSILAAALTLSLLILPVVVIASREAIRAVPSSLRQASYGLGATKLQTVNNVVLPNAVTGIVTGVILAIARAIGETAPLVMIGGAGFISTIPGGWDVLFDRFSVMPLQIYSYFIVPDGNFREVASAGILILLSLLIAIYFVAFLIRLRFERKW